MRYPAIRFWSVDRMQRPPGSRSSRPRAFTLSISRRYRVNFQSERAAALQRNIESTVAIAIELKPDGVALVKQNVFDLLQRSIPRPASCSSMTT